MAKANADANKATHTTSSANMCCAACNKSDDDLKMCNGCKSVFYCNAACQKAHRKDHREECKWKERERNDPTLKQALDATRRWFEETDLFDPPRPRPDCAICLDPLPHALNEAFYQTCCGKEICGACLTRNREVIRMKNKANIEKMKRTGTVLPYIEDTCPMCRAPHFKSNKELIIRLKSRMEANDPEAYYAMASSYRLGTNGVQKDDCKAFNNYLHAADLGSAPAAYNVARLYQLRLGYHRTIHYLELAAKGGDILARRDLGMQMCEQHEAIKHWLIGAEAGSEDCLKLLESLMRSRILSKDEYAKALRAYQKAIDDLKSEERDRFVKEFDIKAYIR